MSLLAGMIHPPMVPGHAAKVSCGCYGCVCCDNFSFDGLLPREFHCIEQLDDNLQPVHRHKCLLYIVARDVAGVIIPDARIKVAIGKDIQAGQTSTEGCAVFVLGHGETAVDENIEISITSALYSAVLRREEPEADSARDLKIIPIGTFLACQSDRTIENLATEAQQSLRDACFLPQAPEPPRNGSTILFDPQKITRSLAPPERQSRWTQITGIGLDF